MATGQRRAYPKERKRQISDEWKERVRAKLAEQGLDHRWLETRIGASRGMVTKMLAPRQNTSSLVDKVCAALDLAPPVTDASVMVEGIDAAIVMAYRAAKERRDRGTVRAVRELVAAVGEWRLFFLGG